MIGAEARREARAGDMERRFGVEGAVALDLLAIADLAWHDTYNDVAVPDEVLDDALEVAAGDLNDLVHSLALALKDWRDLRVNADEVRGRANT